MRKERWKRWLGYSIFVLAIVIPLLAFGISNLFLVSPKGRALIAAKIKGRVMLDASVQGATWSPWNGFTVYGLRLEQPEALRKDIAKPLLMVESASIHPDWLALLGRKVELKGLEIVKPEVLLPIELLSQIPQEEQPPALAAKAPDLAAASPAPGAGSPLQQPRSSPTPLAEPKAAPENQVPPAAVKSVTVESAPTFWMNIREGRFGIVSLGSPSRLLDAAGINGDMPLAGKAAESRITIERLTGFGQTSPGKVILPLKWESPGLSLKATDGQLSGLDFKIGGQIGLVPGFPFMIDTLIPEQKGREFRLGGNAKGKLGAVVAKGRMQGYLAIPATWQGQGVAQVSEVDAELDGHKSSFDTGRALLAFQKGAFRCLDARLLGEEASVMGNAAVLSDGRMAAIVRIVAKPETLLSISGYIRSDSTEPHLTPLSTPQRAALDVQVFGRPGKLFYRPDLMAAPVLLR